MSEPTVTVGLRFTRERIIVCNEQTGQVQHLETFAQLTHHLRRLAQQLQGAAPANETPARSTGRTL
jgi:hypothetical protein